MTFRRLGLALLCLAQLGAAPAPKKAAVPTAQKVAAPARGALAGWNVVLITLDATDPRRIATWGGDKRVMPYLDSLAAKGLVAEHAYTTTGSTAPSHATMMSGALPHQHRAIFNGKALSKTTYWLPEALAGAGYATGGSTIAFFMSKDYGFGRGMPTLRAPGVKDPVVVTNAEALELFTPELERLASAKKPYFAWVHLKGGHQPLVPVDPKYLKVFAPGASPTKAPATIGEDEMLSAAERAQLERRWLQYYDANLLEADDALRRLIDNLRKRGLANKTLFVIVGDHGETFDHGILGEHWPSPWESTLRIPFVLYTEGGAIAPSRVRDRLVTTADITPTILHLLGMPAPKGLEGKNLFGADVRQSFMAASVSTIAYEDVQAEAVRFLRQPNAQTSAPAFQKLRSDAADLERTGIFYWGYIKRGSDAHILKLLHFGAARRNATSNAPGAVQLYDVTADRNETRDLVTQGDRRAAASAMLKEARTMWPFFGRIGAASGLTTDNPQRVLEGLDKDAIEKLKSLGYLQ